VDLGRIVRHLRAVAEESGNFAIVPLSEAAIDAVVLLCGCPRACAHQKKEELSRSGLAIIVVVGDSVDGEVVAESSLATAVERKLAAILKR
jgi:sulfite reductase beta subunit-like hemoprotein